MRFYNSRVAISYSERECLSKEDTSLFQALLYFDIFKFPLTESELWKFSNFSNRSELKERLDWWVREGYIIREGKYYLLHSLSEKVEQREVGEKRVKEMWNKACRRAKLIQGFPFVKAVFISGSISKGVVAEDGDVDFFIITKPGRLWLSRTLLAGFKKIFLLGSYRYFCINYFIDSDFLEIEEKNKYTATEMVTLIPMTGDQDVVNQFFKANNWIKDYYPNFRQKDILFEDNMEKRMKPLLEGFMNIAGGGVMDSFSQWLTTTFWKVKFRKMRSEDFKVALKSNKHVSKHHPLYFQKKVLKALEDSVVRFENTCGLKLDL